MVYLNDYAIERKKPLNAINIWFKQRF